MNIKERFIHSDFYRVFNFKSYEGTVRSLSLLNTPPSSLANAVVSGALNTAFLVENGIDIVSVGLITIMPYIAYLLSMFSPMVLARFKSRQRALMLNCFIYFSATVLGTTVMPFFVSDPGRRTAWFAAFVLIGNVSMALLGNGDTGWMARIVPKGKDLNTYMAYTNMLSNVFTNGMGVLVAFVADALSKTGNQLVFITVLRLIAFVIFIIGALVLYGIPKEDTSIAKPVQYSPWHVITEPLKTKSFMLVVAIPFLYTLVGALNGGTYSVYLLDTLKVPLYFQYISGCSVFISSIFLSGIFKRWANRTSPYWMVACLLIACALLELCFAMVGPQTIALYVVFSVIQGVNAVAFNLSYGSLIYLAMPEDKNKDLYAAFWRLMTYVASLISVSLGTTFIAAVQKVEPVSFLGADWYSSQLLCMIKFVLFIPVCVYVFKMIPHFPKDKL